MRVCECCGQPLQDVRNGVRLTPLKARIFDLIKARPGINRKELCELIYGQVSFSGALTIGAHVSQIRDKFEATDTVVRAIAHNGYRVMKRRVSDVV